MNDELVTKVFAVCFTENGKKICDILHTYIEQIEIFCCFGTHHLPLKDFVRDVFEKFDCETEKSLIFVGALGICVRSISSFVDSKLSDPAVICIDELGKFVIPVLSGHIGGANDLALKIAGLLGSIPVITTATDINKKWAVDLWAKKHGVLIEESKKHKIKEISSGVLKNVKVLSLGVGCKKDTDTVKFEETVLKILKENDLPLELVKSVSSVDVKKNESCILNFAGKYGLELNFYTAQQLNEVEGNFSASDFVKSQVGVDCVCERSAVKALKNGDFIMLLKKTSADGITVSVAG